MRNNYLILSIPVLISLVLAGCSSNDDNGDDNSGNSNQTSQFNPDLPASVNTGEPGGDTTSIAGLWDGSVMNDNATDVIYWNVATNGVLTRFDYQQDGGLNASGENCYIVGDPITVTPEGGDDYSIFDVAASAVATDETLTVTFLEADKNDLNENGDTDEIPVLTWSKLISPVLEDLNSCTPSTDNAVINNTVAPASTFFNGSMNGEDKTGDGITFSRPAESSLLIRGFWGPSQSHYQIDILVNQTDDGTYRLDDIEATGSISEVIGLDAVGASFSASGGLSDSVTFMWDKDAGRIVGNFSFTAVGGNSNFLVSGEFDNSVSESQNWDCNFEDEFISRCGFIE